MITQVLKERTQQLHEQAERAVDLPRRLVSVEAYSSLLARLHGFYSPLESQIESVSTRQETRLDLPSRRKAHLIRQDLIVLGRTDDAIQTIPDCSMLPQIGDWPAALGCLYVLEGSTLGGKFIQKAVAGRLGFTAANGCAFFNGYGEQTGIRWHEFCQVVCDYSGTSPTDDQKIVDAALETFRCFGEWIKC